MWRKNWVIFDIESSLKLSSPSVLYPILPVCFTSHSFLAILPVWRCVQMSFCSFQKGAWPTTYLNIAIYANSFTPIQWAPLREVCFPLPYLTCFIRYLLYFGNTSPEPSCLLAKQHYLSASPDMVDILIHEWGTWLFAALALVHDHELGTEGLRMGLSTPNGLTRTKEMDNSP